MGWDLAVRIDSQWAGIWLSALIPSDTAVGSQVVGIWLSVLIPRWLGFDYPQVLEEKCKEEGRAAALREAAAAAARATAAFAASAAASAAPDADHMQE